MLIPPRSYAPSNQPYSRNGLIVIVAMAVLGVACCAGGDDLWHHAATFIRSAAAQEADDHAGHEDVCPTACILSPTVLVCGDSLAVARTSVPPILPASSGARSALSELPILPRAAPLFLLHQSLLI